jgi:hypothetical protein
MDNFSVSNFVCMVLEDKKEDFWRKEIFSVIDDLAMISMLEMAGWHYFILMFCILQSCTPLNDIKSIRHYTKKYVTYS